MACRPALPFFLYFRESATLAVHGISRCRRTCNRESISGLSRLRSAWLSKSASRTAFFFVRWTFRFRGRIGASCAFVASNPWRRREVALSVFVSVRVVRFSNTLARRFAVPVS